MYHILTVNIGKNVSNRYICSIYKSQDCLDNLLSERINTTYVVFTRRKPVQVIYYLARRRHL